MLTLELCCGSLVILSIPVGLWMLRNAMLPRSNHIEYGWDINNPFQINTDREQH